MKDQARLQILIRKEAEDRNFRKRQSLIRKANRLIREGKQESKDFEYLMYKAPLDDRTPQERGLLGWVELS